MKKFIISHFDNREALEGLRKIVLKCSFFFDSQEDEKLSRELMKSVEAEMKEFTNLEYSYFNTRNLENTPGQAQLGLLIRVFKNSEKAFLANVSLILLQNVYLERQKDCLVSWVNTWDYDTVVLMEEMDIEGLKTILIQQIRQFHVSWQKANK